uniref:Uncharacterized protein n=1 Tax=Oryza sativa subsp. japonica TaxID=39947 RepID=Q7XHZ7_ORYSJ|nr:hypothetical protein [Oryza sativa Japonica Group]BAC84405.1 hypothetical protein [Oryza sativa Japonica Group]
MAAPSIDLLRWPPHPCAARLAPSINLVPLRRPPPLTSPACRARSSLCRRHPAAASPCAMAPCGKRRRYGGKEKK